MRAGALPAELAIPSPKFRFVGDDRMSPAEERDRDRDRDRDTPGSRSRHRTKRDRAHMLTSLSVHMPPSSPDRLDSLEQSSPFSRPRTAPSFGSDAPALNRSRSLVHRPHLHHGYGHNHQPFLSPSPVTTDWWGLDKQRQSRSRVSDAERRLKRIMKILERCVPPQFADLLSTPSSPGMPAPARIQSRKYCQKLVAQIYTEYDTRSDLAMPIGRHVFEHFLYKYGLPVPARQALVDLINSAFHHRHSSRYLFWFGDILGLENDPLSEATMHFYIASTTTLQKTRVGPPLPDDDNGAEWVSLVRAQTVIFQRFADRELELREALCAKVRAMCVPDPPAGTSKLRADELMELMMREWLYLNEPSTSQAVVDVPQPT